mgnify:CR=1 FL=1
MSSSGYTVDNMTKTKKTERPIAADNPNTEAILTRMPPELVQNLDEWVDKLNAKKKVGDPKWTRSNVILKVLSRVYEERGVKGEEP